MSRKKKSKEKSEPPGPAPKSGDPDIPLKLKAVLKCDSAGSVEVVCSDIDGITIGGTPHKEAAAGFEEVDHTADVALRLWAPEFETLLVQAALGAAWIMTGKLPSGPFPARKLLALDAFDRESLLVAFLGELAYSAEADREVFVSFEFERVTDRRLVALAKGVRVPALKTVIKAVTYHGLEIVETERGVEAAVVLDV